MGALELMDRLYIFVELFYEQHVFHDQKHYQEHHVEELVSLGTD